MGIVLKDERSPTMLEHCVEPVGSGTEPALNLPPPQLTDEQWLLISDFIPVPVPDPRGGRPRTDARRCLEGILWVLRSGARWKDLPRSFPSYVTCWRRFVEWSSAGVWDQAWGRLVEQLDRRGAIEWEQGFGDGTFASAKKGAI
jgi:transposase